MRLTIKHTATLVLVFSTLFAVSGLSARPTKSLLASANGKGKIKIGKEEFPLHHVVVKLKEDGAAEITLVSDIQLFFSGTWADNAADKGIDVKISGTAQSSWQATGKLFLRDDGKSIARLSLLGTNKFRKQKVEVSFVAD